MIKKVEFNNDLRSLSQQELSVRAKEDLLRLKKLEFAHAISPIENPMSIRSLRRDIARVKTELQKRALA